MKVKNQLQVITFAALIFSSQSVFAQASYVGPFNTALATSGFSCEACHSPANFSTKLPIAADRLKANLTTLDSDGDGVSNGIEVRMATDFNDAAASPTGAMSTDGIFVSTATSVTTATANDLAVETNSTFTLAASESILGGKSITPTLPTAGAIELAFEDSEVSSAKVYQVVSGVATELTATVGTKGSVSFTTTDAQPKLLIVGSSGATGGSSNTDTASATGCMTNMTMTPFMMFFGLMMLGMMSRRNRTK